jgi:hypothetical protein
MLTIKCFQLSMWSGLLRNFRAFSKEFENLIVRTLYTEGRLLGFSYDFSVTRNSSSNADAMVLASARLRGIHPLIIFKMADVQGGMPLKRALARTMASAFWWWIIAWQRLLESTLCVPYSVSWPFASAGSQVGVWHFKLETEWIDLDTREGQGLGQKTT